MIRFECDYLEGAHPKVLEALVRTNDVQTPGYSTDEYCAYARTLIKNACACEDCDVHFLVGGTQTNSTVIAAALRAHQGVLSAESGHINVHETGAIEMNGHKVIPLPTALGKISAASVEAALVAHYADHDREHTVQPGMVYISHPTEYGTLYTKEELTALSECCRRYDIPLFLDGARLGYGLAAEGTDLTLPDIAALCDVFYIGGTKVGALFGEALVITKDSLKKDFRYVIKQHGGMLAKGRLLGIQFAALMENDLYTEIAAHANRLAYRLRDGIAALGYPFFMESPTNQQFPILPDAILARLEEKYSFSHWGKVDGAHSIIRICTSFMTPEDYVDTLLADLTALTNEART
jgi:threonine aldolase